MPPAQPTDRKPGVECTLVRLGTRTQGHLELAEHHMIFRSNQREAWICYPIIEELGRYTKTIRVVCKDFMFLRFEFASPTECTNTFMHIMPRTSQKKLYAYDYTPAPPENEFNSWKSIAASVAQEYERMGAIGNAWRVTDVNSDYALCPTYPSTLVVPESIGDNVLAHAARFRSKGRIPVLSYFHSLNKCTITRCAQPLVGMRQARKMQDERLIKAIFETTEPPQGTRGACSDNLIADLRPSANAIAQTALGGGTENMSRYPDARKVYFGIDNLHVMRDSVNQIHESLKHSDLSPAPPSPALLERSGWLQHVKLILDGSQQIIEQVHARCSHVVVHCSDGWDRTPQLTSLSMLLLDPFYRTLHGFMVLIEKEWIGFGHKFCTRHGHKEMANITVPDLDDANRFGKMFQAFMTEVSKRGLQTGPIFRQWLDCVYQLVYAFPDRFEFNERFLRRLLYHSYACQYGTFLFDSEAERISSNAEQKTRSVWDYFLARREQFVNPSYKAYPDVFLPPAQVRWWAASFGRADKDMNDPEAWKRFELAEAPAPEQEKLAVAESEDRVPSPSLSASVVNAKETAKDEQDIKPVEQSLNNLALSQSSEDGDKPFNDPLINPSSAEGVYS